MEIKTKISTTSGSDRKAIGRGAVIMLEENMEETVAVENHNDGEPPLFQNFSFVYKRGEQNYKNRSKESG